MDRRPFIVAVFALWQVFAVDLHAQAPAPQREPFESAIDRGLEYLERFQQADGSWPSGRGLGFRGDGGVRDPAVTALGVMAFLSAGHVPGEGRYGDVVSKGIRFVQSQQQANGLIAGTMFGNGQMYSHGICTLMLAEVVGLLPDRREAANVRKQLERAVNLLRAAQTIDGENSGGWRYTIRPGDADMSVTAWQVMALRAAKNVGCDVPPQAMLRAVAYVKRCHEPNTGGYRYTRYSHVTVPCTGAAILSLELCGKEYHKSPESLKAASYLLRRENILEQNRSHFFYGIYYTSQAMFQIGGNYWQVYRQVLHHQLLSKYPQHPSGYWSSMSNDDAVAGPNYCTAMAILALTVEYRFLPIYQRGEEPAERDEPAGRK